MVEMFKIEARKHVHYGHGSWSSRDLSLYVDFELPFVPQVGMGISGILEGSFGIKEINYDLATSTFIIYTEKDETRYHQMLNASRMGTKAELTPFKEIVEEYLSIGWKMRTGDIIAGEEY